MTSAADAGEGSESDVRCQMSDVRCQMADVRWQMADGQMSDGRWQMGRWQMADGRWQMTPARARTSSVIVALWMSVKSVLKFKVFDHAISFR